VDRKAAEALINCGKSLLPAGIVAVSGNFIRGDTVVITDNETKKDFARGLVNYGCADVEKIKGKKSGEARKLVDNAWEEVIHRDNLVLL
jgi:glutamate 5-kinase